MNREVVQELYLSLILSSYSIQFLTYGMPDYKLNHSRRTKIVLLIILKHDCLGWAEGQGSVISVKLFLGTLEAHLVRSQDLRGQLESLAKRNQGLERRGDSLATRATIWWGVYKYWVFLGGVSSMGTNTSVPIDWFLNVSTLTFSRLVGRGALHITEVALILLTQKTRVRILKTFLSAAL